MLPYSSAVVPLLLLQVVAEVAGAITDVPSEEEARWAPPERALSCLLQHAVRDEKDPGSTHRHILRVATFGSALQDVTSCHVSLASCNPGFLGLKEKGAERKGRAANLA